ncbi:hypothetical protein G7047_29370 [Diaphorobacter sp. HDW4A]|uniref:hypothetical protein n=1 Tax=Diaphorobacter sp. HDW4A TaxID=2714924 RepID=UPI00140BABFE|nr:hypothetical protein [Diaphorobacter sp. HDW4A]QIL83589.1 hypothetical protein G7047_29370 [Diaphorobacter sp. HDW4A]
MSTLTYTPLRVVEHLEKVEVVFRHSDLPKAFAQMLVSLPICADGKCLEGVELDAGYWIKHRRANGLKRKRGDWKARRSYRRYRPHSAQSPR